MPIMTPPAKPQKPPYPPVLPYGRVGGAICQFVHGDQEIKASAYLHESLTELIEAYEYAAEKVADGSIHDRDSERSCFRAIWVAKEYVKKAELDGQPQEIEHFLGTLAASHVDAWDVLEDGDDPAEKEHLYEAAARGLEEILALTADSELLVYLRGLDMPVPAPDPPHT